MARARVRHDTQRILSKSPTGGAGEYAAWLLDRACTALAALPSAVHACERPPVGGDADGLAHETSPAECHASGRARVPHTGGWEWHILEIGDSERRVTRSRARQCFPECDSRHAGMGNGLATQFGWVARPTRRPAPSPDRDSGEDSRWPTRWRATILSEFSVKSHGLGGGGAAWLRDQALSQTASCEKTLANPARRPDQPTRQRSHCLSHRVKVAFNPVRDESSRLGRLAGRPVRRRSPRSSCRVDPTSACCGSRRGRSR